MSLESKAERKHEKTIRKYENVIQHKQKLIDSHQDKIKWLKEQLQKSTQEIEMQIIKVSELSAEKWALQGRVDMLKSLLDESESE